MKKKVSIFLVYYLAIVLAVITGISFGIGQNWWAMIWALFTSCWVGIALIHHKRGNRAECKYHEYIESETLGGKDD